MLPLTKHMLDLRSIYSKEKGVDAVENLTSLYHGTRLLHGLEDRGAKSFPLITMSQLHLDGRRTLGAPTKVLLDDKKAETLMSILEPELKFQRCHVEERENTPTRLQSQTPTAGVETGGGAQGA